MLDAVSRGGRAVLLEPLRAIAREKVEELRTVAPHLEEILGVSLRVSISTGDYRSDNETFFAAPPGEGEIVVATPERFEALLRNPDHDEWLASIEAVCVDEAHLLGSPHRGPTLEYLVTRLLCLPSPPRLVLLSATLGDLGRAHSWLSPCDAIVTKERQPPLHKEVIELTPEEDANQAVAELVRETLDDPEASVLVFVY
jgi:helicase